MHSNKPKPCTWCMYCHFKIHLSYPSAITVTTNCRKPRKLIEDRTTVFVSRSISAYLLTIITLLLCQKVARSWISLCMAQICSPLLIRLQCTCKLLCIRGQTITHVFWRSLFPGLLSCDDKNGMQYYHVHDRITVLRFKFLCGFIGSSVDCNNSIL